MSNKNFKCGPHPHSHGGWYPGDIHTGPCHPCGPDLYHPGVPGPVPAPIPWYPHHGHIHPPRPPRPEDMKFVTKKEFNEVLQNISKATLYSDTSINGTTVTVGGIPAGTKFNNNLTFTKLVDMMLFPKGGTDNNTPITPDDNEYVTVNEFNTRISELEESLKSYIQEEISKIDTSGGGTTTGVTMDEVNEAIRLAINNLVSTDQMNQAITIATDGLATEQFVLEEISKIDTSGGGTTTGVTMDEVNEAITNATDGLATEQFVLEEISKIDTESTTGITMDEVNEAITNATNGLVTTSQLDSAIDEAATYTDEAVNDLPTNSQMNQAITNAVNGLATTGYVDRSIADGDFVTNTKLAEILTNYTSKTEQDTIMRENILLLTEELCTT